MGCKGSRVQISPLRPTLHPLTDWILSARPIPGFPVTTKWPALHPDRIQLYSIPSPNGVKASIMLEETGLPYEAHRVEFETGDQRSPEYLSLNPGGKIPAILDPDGPGGKPFALFESGAILVYLAEKAGRLLPRDPASRHETLQWLMFQVGGVGPTFGQVGYFHKFEGRAVEDPRPLEYFAGQSKALLGLLDARLADRRWLMGDEYTIADVATFPMVRNLVGYYGAGELVGFARFANVARSLADFLARPAVARGITVPGPARERGG